MKHTLYNEAMAYPDMRILVNCDDRLGDHVIVSLNDILEFVKKNEYSSDIESYDIRDAREEEMIKCAWCGAAVLKANENLAQQIKTILRQE